MSDNDYTNVFSIGKEKFNLLPEDVVGQKDIDRWNGFIDAYERSKDLVDIDFPLQLDIELTTTCNFKCTFCLHGITNIPKAVMGFDTFKKIIDEGARHGLVSIKMNYVNEPLLVRDLERYVKYARDNGVLNVYFATNGSLLNAKRSRSLIESGVTKIMISLDATDSETFESMRKNKKYDKIVKSIHEFIRIRNEMGKRFPLVRVNFLTTKLNESQKMLFMNMWKDVADMVWFQEQNGVPGSEENDVFVISDRSDWKCSIPSRLMVIDGYGNILPCCTFYGREMPVGSINDMSISEAWNGEKMSSLRALHRRKEYYLNDICKECMDGASSDADPVLNVVS